MKYARRKVMRKGRKSRKVVPKVSKTLKRYIKHKINKTIGHNSEVKRFPGLNVIDPGTNGLTRGIIYHDNPISRILTNTATAEGAVGRTLNTLGFKISLNLSNIGRYLSGVSYYNVAPKSPVYFMLIGFTSSAYTSGSGNSVFIKGYSSSSFAMGRHAIPNDAINCNIDTNKHKVFFKRRFKLTPFNTENTNAVYDFYNFQDMSRDIWIPYRRKIVFESYSTSDTTQYKRRSSLFCSIF